MKITPTFVMLCGLPGSGKSYSAKELSLSLNSSIFSSDEIRKEICGDENSQINNEDVFKTLHIRIKESLKNGESVIYDATNINSKRRRAFLSEIRSINCNKLCVIIATPYAKCIENNNNRARKVPVEVIKRMYLNWNTPYYFEGWDSISIANNNEQKKSIFEWFYSMRNYNQDNSHHTHTLGNHCIEVAKLCGGKDLLFYAGLLHDCGKPFTKSFLNHKTEYTKDAHYYNHHHVGAYDSLIFSYPPEINALDVSILVDLHMQPYLWDKNLEHRAKIINKYKNLWGEELFNLVMCLHKADVGSH